MSYSNSKIRPIKVLLLIIGVLKNHLATQDCGYIDRRTSREESKKVCQERKIAQTNFREKRKKTEKDKSEVTQTEPNSIYVQQQDQFLRNAKNT